MAMAARLSLRMQKELKLLLTDPPPGASFPSLSEDCSFSSLTSIDALIQGPNGTVYANGVFKIKIQIPERYPFQPPVVTFSTPIYHPNIDNGGRICLDILNLPPKGTWQPSLNISTVLTSIGLLLSEPNPDDGLMHDASREYKYYRQAFDQNARSMTEKCARVGESGSCSDSPENNSCPCPCPCPSITQTETQVPDASTYTKSISSFTKSGSKLSLGFPQSSSNIIYSESHDYVECGSSTSVGKIDNPTLEKVTDQSAAMNRQSGKYDIPEDGIVLDSEDSEDEKVPMRRCLPVKRKRNRASY